MGSCIRAVEGLGFHADQLLCFPGLKVDSPMVVNGNQEYSVETYEIADI